MFRVFKTKRFAVAIGVVGALTAAGFAFAYFTSSGSGTGTAGVGTTQALVIHGAANTTLYPGGTSPVTFTVDNNGGGPEKLGTISLTNVGACSVAWSGNLCKGSSTGDVNGCGGVPDPGNTTDGNSKDFYMADVTVNTEIATGTGHSVSQQGTLGMNNLSHSQDACKGANLLLTFSGSAAS
jgi:hypothetical protein